jgi:hypothetical protein
LFHFLEQEAAKIERETRKGAGIEWRKLSEEI